MLQQSYVLKCKTLQSSPVKYAASLLSLSKPEVRLPLVQVTEKTKNEVRKALEFAKLI